MACLRITAKEVGFFEDYEDEEILEVGISGIDESGARRALSIQRSTYDPGEQEIQSGMDSYNISTEQGFTVYGCLRSVQLAGLLLTLEFVDRDAEILEISNPVEVDLTESGVDSANLSGKLRVILEWGSQEKRPELVGM